MRTAIDTNVLLALWAGEASAEKASRFLDLAMGQGALVISPIVYVEGLGNPSISEDAMNEFLESTRITVDWSLERRVWGLAALRFEQYAKRQPTHGSGEVRRLPADFIIGAHATLHADRLVTLDQRRYRADFPELMLVEL